MEKHPDQTIEATCIPWNQYWVKMPALINSGVDLDLFWANVLNGVEFIDKDLLLPISTDNINLDQFASAAVKPFQSADGTLYGMPIFSDVLGLIYNKELFDKANLPYPTADWTWDDLRDVSEKLTIRNANGEAEQWGFYIPSTNGTWNVFYSYVYQSGSEIFTPEGMSAFNNDQAKQAIQYVYDLVNVQKVSPDVQEVQELSSTDLFVSGKVAMITETTPSFTTQVENLGAEKIDCVPLPAGAREGTPLSTIAYVASKNSKNPEGVQAFLDFLATEEPNKIMAEKNTPSMIGTSELWVAQFPGNNVAQTWVEPMGTNAFPCPYVKKQNSEVWTIIGTELGNIIGDVKTIDQGLADLEQQINELQQ
jgi:multiple sugar transport system substrate-binding protein